MLFEMKDRQSKPEEIKKPCEILEDYCPFGARVELYPLHPEFDDAKSLNDLPTLDTGYNCSTLKEIREGI